MSKKELGRFSPPFNGSAGGIRLSLVVGDKGLFSFVVKIIDGDSGMFGLVLVFEDINKLVGRCIISSDGLSLLNLLLSFKELTVSDLRR